MKCWLNLLAIAVAGLAVPAAAQQAAAPPVPQVSSPIRLEGTFALYPQDAGRLEEAEARETWNVFGTDPVVRNVTVPSLTPFLPAPDKATGAAVIVAPGGGFMLLSIENEGIKVAQWLAQQGVAAYLLKYRVQPTPAGADEFAQMGAERMARSAERTAAPTPYAPAIEDGLAAVRYVRQNAGALGIDENRIGMIGFSAGAMTTLGVTLANDEAAAPDFIGLIYGPLTEVETTGDLPPLFAAIAADDRLIGSADFGILKSWRNSGAPAELHVYQQGGHGFGMLENGTTTTLWPGQFLAWMDTNNFLNEHAE